MRARRQLWDALTSGRAVGPVSRSAMSENENRSRMPTDHAPSVAPMHEDRRQRQHRAGTCAPGGRERGRQHADEQHRHRRRPRRRGRPSTGCGSSRAPLAGSRWRGRASPSFSGRGRTTAIGRCSRTRRSTAPACPSDVTSPSQRRRVDGRGQLRRPGRLRRSLRARRSRAPRRPAGARRTAPPRRQPRQGSRSGSPWQSPCRRGRARTRCRTLPRKPR